MARHWLDVVRYADSSGFSNDFERPHAWRYRDYVVRSFNSDKPYDRFVLEQLAGDELDESDPDCLIATGFLRMGPWEHTSMTVAAETPWSASWNHKAPGGKSITATRPPVRTVLASDRAKAPLSPMWWKTVRR